METTGTSSPATTATTNRATTTVGIIATSGAPPANSNLMMYCIIHGLLYLAHNIVQYT